MTLVRIGLVASITALSTITACSADVDDEALDEDTEMSSEELQKGYCTPGQIRSAQAQCKGYCAAKNMVSRGITRCVPNIEDPTGRTIDAPCACRKKAR